MEPITTKESKTMKSAEQTAIQGPTVFDSAANFSGQVPGPEWDTVLGRNRDSDCISESNFESALKQLGGESDNVEILRYGHWACGWVEYLNVKRGTPEHEVAMQICDSLESYPVLDEFDLSERESETANEIWKNCYNEIERIQYIREHRKEFEFYDYSDLISCVRGKHFPGYASELVY